MFEGNNTPSHESYGFEAESYAPNPEYAISGEELSALMQKPELMFNSLKTTERDKILRHYKNREHLLDRSRFLGMGNDGLVASIGDPSKDLICMKFIWKTLEVYPGKGLTFEEIYNEEILKLHEISRQFEEVRRITRANQRESNRISVIKNTPAEEAVMQESARKILLSEGHACYVPEVFAVESFHERIDESEEDPDPLYFLDEEYTTISMQNVMGKSVQDIILGYPDTKEYLDLIDLNKMEKDIVQALTSLHEHKIRHQDITIRNIMFDAKQARPVLIDFGKSKYGTGDVSDDKEMEHVKEVFNHLRDFFRDPENKREKLIEELRKRAAKIGV